MINFATWQFLNMFKLHSAVQFKVMLFHTMTFVTLTIVFLCRDSGLFK
jgi:hypothetical protein